MALKVGENLLGKTGKFINLNYPTPHENVHGTPVAVPASEPASALSSITIASGNMPTSLNGFVASWKNVGFIVCHGLNLTGSNQTINYRILKNAGSVSTGSNSITANQYFTINFLNHSTYKDLQVGDVLEIKLWASATDLFDLRFFGIQVIPTDITLAFDKPVYNAIFTVRSLTLGQDFSLTSYGGTTYPYSLWNLVSSGVYPNNNIISVVAPQFSELSTGSQYGIYDQFSNSAFSNASGLSFNKCKIIESIYWEV